MKKSALKLLRRMQEEWVSYRFKRKYRMAPKDFTRESVLDFATTMLLVMRLVKKSIKVELMDFFYQTGKACPIPSRQAFSQSREKISYCAFKHFFEESCEIAIAGDGARLFKNRFRLFAVDGTAFVVGKLEKLKDFFGTSTSIAGKAMCRISGVVDVLNECLVSAKVSPFSVGERALAITQIIDLMAVKNALFLLDRGYWSPDLVRAIIANGQKFVMRLASNVPNAVMLNDEGKSLPLRRYTFLLESGAQEILLTNLSVEEASDEELAALYAKRWGAETKYLELKARFQIDRFSGSSVNIVLQDIYSTLLVSNWVAFACFEADEIIEARTAGKGNKYAQKANRSACIAAFRRRFVDICLLDDEFRFERALDRLFEDISRCVSYIGKSKPKPRIKHNVHAPRRNTGKPVL